MEQFSEKSLSDLAQSAIAMGRIIEAHTDQNDVVCRVVVELPEWVRNQAVQASIAQLWQEKGFMASVTKDGLLIVDGVSDDACH